MPDTAILVTRFLSESGIAEVVDFMPIDRPHVASDRRRIVRAVRGIRGEVEFEARVEPRFDYARQSHELHVDGTTAVFESDDQRLQLTSLAPLERDGDDVRSRFTVACRATPAGSSSSPARPGHPSAIGGGEVDRLYLDTDGVLAALARAEHVPRALARGGGAVGDHAQADDLRAVGGPRGRADRRRCPSRWVAPATGTTATRGCATARSRSSRCWAWDSPRRPRRSATGCAPASRSRPATGSGPLKIMYRIDGSSELTEETLDHLDGYMGSRPVRIGNGASDQLQLDIYGEAMNSIHALDSGALGDWGVGHDGWTAHRRA